MNAVKSVVKDGRVSFDVPSDWPEGCPVMVEPIPGAGGKIGIDESDWSDDPASLAEWDAWIKTIEPLEFTPEEGAALARFSEEMRRYNIEAVRRQMEVEP
ncbi:MAG TPA: hypothetical protein VND64_13970 [Pirellulales bacterium]|nr:hypothetical protein [Pirellulales bacterium]